MRARIVEGPGTYYVGIIDILQEWNYTKVWLLVCKEIVWMDELWWIWGFRSCNLFDCISLNWLRHWKLVMFNNFFNFISLQRMERFLKTYIKLLDGDGLSAIQPTFYADRFWKRCVVDTFEGE
jgi:hypothetical protein